MKFLKIFSLQTLTLIFYLILIYPSSAFAYTTNMSASVVLGQSGFTTNSSGTTSTSLNGPRGVRVCDGKLIVADTSNNRVLIWNSIPTSSGISADVVIGQADFTSGSANSGGSTAANTISNPWDIACGGGKLFIADGDNSGNRRVLIFNSIPTSNGASADVVVGQASMTASVNYDGNDMDKIGAADGVASDGTKLVVLDSGNQRFLVFNTIPTSNGATADVVVGSNHGEGCAANRISGESTSVFIDKGKLFLGATFPTGAHRVLIWNSIPTTNNQSADVVVGQPDFTTCTSTTGTSSGFSNPFGVSTDGKGRLLVADRGSQRVIVFNSIPSSNGASADFVIGQSSFSGTSTNQGASSPAANTLSSARFVTATDNKIIVSDAGNNRILIFNDVTNNPGLTLNNSPEDRDNGIIRLKGSVNIPSTSSYTISSVQYSLNGGNFSGTTPVDGSFNSTSEDFYIDFDPKSNQPKDINGNLIDGYTMRVKSTNNNLDETDRAFYFTPFNLNEPLDKINSTLYYPVFDFSVNKQRQNLKDNLSKYQVQIKKGGNSSNTPWETIIDDIPVDFSQVQTNSDNLKREDYFNKDPNNGNGVYETSKFTATYYDDSSGIKVSSKINSIYGSIQWRVLAIDKTGHIQDSGARSLRVNTSTNNVSSSYFPLAILNISGLGNPHISTTNLSLIKNTYYLASLNPIFYGITYANAKVTLSLTDQSCSTNCTKTYSTTANLDSRYGINVPAGDLTWGKKYTTNVNVALNQDYNELPTFTLSTK